jgi:hypothetical protein
MPRPLWMLRLLSYHPNYHITPLYHFGVVGVTTAGQRSCTSLINKVFPDLWPKGAEINFCLIIDHCRTILYYIILCQDLAFRRRYCRLFIPLFRPGGLTESWTLTF